MRTISTEVHERMMRSSDTPTTRELARRLLSHEEQQTSLEFADARAVSRVCDKLRRPLTTMVGAAGFRSLLMRALTLAKQESQELGSFQVKPDGSLEMSHSETGESDIVLVSHLVGLMDTFIGESLTLRLLNDAWPGLPDCELKFERDESK